MSTFRSLAARLAALVFFSLPLAMLPITAHATDLSVTAANVVAGSDAITEQGFAGETITAGQVLYKDTSTNRWMKADSNAATALARTPTAIALNGAANGQPIGVQKSGTITIGATMTAGVTYYLSDTPGGICPLADVGSGEYFAIIGIATTTGILKLSFNYSGVSG